MKECKKCGEKKELTDFYKHPKMLDGSLNHCKECVKKRVRENRKKNIEYYKEFDRKRANLPHRVKAREEYQKTDSYKSRHDKAVKRWVKRNPLKRLANNLINNQLRDGKITKKPCELCGDIESHAHHDDYSKPLDIRWLCSKHHREWHKKNGKAANG